MNKREVLFYKDEIKLIYKDNILEKKFILK